MPSISKRTKVCQKMHLAVSSRSFKCRCCGSLLVSLSLPVPSVLNIRLTAKQHNVVQLTCSSHNLAPVCSSIHMVNLSSIPTLEHMRTFFFGLSSPFQTQPCLATTFFPFLIISFLLLFFWQPSLTLQLSISVSFLFVLSPR